MERFMLNPDCFLVKGVKRGAIYDLLSGNVYSVNDDSVKILSRCEEGAIINDIIQEISHVDIKEAKSYLRELELLSLGTFLSKDQPIPIKAFLNSYLNRLDFAWLELTLDCNLKCIHCYEGDNHHKQNANLSGLITQDWKNTIKNLYDLGCRKIQFIGGEPLLFGKDIFILIDLAKDLEFELVELFTNASLLTDRDIDLLSKYGVCVAVSIYSSKPEIHDRITGIKGSFDRTISNVKKLSDKGIKFRCSMIVMKQNEKNVEETIGFFKELGSYDPERSYDIARPIGKGINNILSDKLKSDRLRTIPAFLKITKEDFSKRKKGNSCWQDKLCITPNGNVIPCIMAREEIIGNVRNQNLKDIFEKETTKYWKISKDEIETCKDCEYRYACNDCRPMVKGQTGNLYAKSPDCLYDPYTGEWKTKKEVIDEKLVYDC